MTDDYLTIEQENIYPNSILDQENKERYTIYKLDAAKSPFAGKLLNLLTSTDPKEGVTTDDYQ